MDREEKIIGGVLHERSGENGEFKISVGIKAGVINSLFRLSEEERKDIFGYFCQYCGSSDLPCYCWNDE